MLRRIALKGLVAGWTRTLDTSGEEQATDVAVHGRRVYLTGLTSGRLGGQVSGGGTDTFVRTYDPAGQRLWQRQVGDGGDERGSRVAATPDGVIHLFSPASPGTPLGTHIDGYTTTGAPVWRRTTDTSVYGMDADWNFHGLRVSGFTDETTYGREFWDFTDSLLQRYRVQVG